MNHFVIALLALLQILAAPSSTNQYAPDTPEPDSVEAIAKATTDPHFLSPWVSYLPQSSTVVSPQKFLGRIPGAPGEFVDSAKAYAYCRALAASSPRVRVFTIGRSEEGRDIMMLAIADESGIRDLDRLKVATAALADPRGTDQAAAEQLIATSRPIYYFNAALHSDETGSTEAMLELAYRLAASETPMIQGIRSKLVVLINPVSNPDGRDKVVEWFYRYLKGKTDRAGLPRMSPPYWSKYAFVDINRDTHQQTHETTKAVHRMFYEWHPTVVHDLHEGSPFMMTWNGTGPYNPNIDPITYSEFLEMSFHEVQAMTAMGMPGVSTWNFGEAFSHLYLDSVAMNHNSIGRGYETWGNGSAETMKRSIPKTALTMEWYRPVPPPSAEVVWSARDNLNYQETGSLAVLDYAARNSKEMLRNFYRKGWDSWRNGLDQPPYAFVIPEDQGDRTRVAQMVGRLLAQHIEVSRTQNSLSLKEGNYPAGSYVVRLDQPYRNYAVDLLTPQNFPKGSGEPYDDVSWELPAHYHLNAIPIADPSIHDAALTPLKEEPHPAGKVSGLGPIFLLKDTGQEALFAARYRLSGFEIEIAEKSFRVGDSDFPAGSWILRSQDSLPPALRSTATELGLDFTSYPFFYLGLCVVVLIAVLIGVTRLNGSRFGLALRSLREDERAAAAFGRNIYLTKLKAYVLGAGIGGLGGALFAGYLSAFNPSAWSPVETIILYAAILVGGRGSTRGVVLGVAVMVMGLQEATRYLPEIANQPSFAPAFRLILTGIILVLFIRFRPQGILPERRFRDEDPAGKGGAATVAAESPVIGPALDSGAA